MSQSDGGELTGAGESEPSAGRLDSSRLTFTARIARWSARHRWWVAALSLVVIVLAVLVMVRVGSELRDDDEGAGESAEAVKLMNERFRSVSVPAAEERPIPHRTERLIFSNPSLEVDDAAFRTVVEGLMEDIRALPKIASAVSYYDSSDPDLVSDDRRAVLGSVALEDPAAKSSDDIDIGPLLQTVESAEGAASGFEIGVISFDLIEDEFDEILTEDFSRILFVSLGLGLVILILAFRALVAAVIPLAMAIGAIVTALGIATLVSHIYPLVDLYAEMVLLMGLAVGIDYSLFIVSRFRSERRAGREKLDAITMASNTTGRAVFYAGVTVVVSLAGLSSTPGLRWWCPWPG